MNFFSKYSCIPAKNQKWISEDNIHSMVPIRFKDRYEIMKWRNEQIYHLRQQVPLTKESQDNYFKKTISKIFSEEQPNQILFSFLENEVCVGYGGLVHINWFDKNAEISFLMNTNHEDKHFKFYWKNFLNLLEKVAFEELNLHKIYTYAFDIRPKLFSTIESLSFRQEALLKEHFLFGQLYKDVRIHSKINPISIRDILNSDCNYLFDWANETDTRKNSIDSKPISIEEHIKWFEKRLNNKDSNNFMCLFNNNPAGIVWFDNKREASIISITINPNYRGKKLSSKFLKIAIESFIKNNNSKIIAYIKPENLASIKAFKNSNFFLEKKEKIKDQTVLKFQYRDEK